MEMRGALGLLLVGGGAFTLIALFNGTLKFPLGNVNLFGGLGNALNPTGYTPTGQTGVTPTGAGYYTSTSQGSTTQQQATCRQAGGVWFNGQCRHFTGAGANK